MAKKFSPEYFESFGENNHQTKIIAFFTKEEISKNLQSNYNYLTKYYSKEDVASAIFRLRKQIESCDNYYDMRFMLNDELEKIYIEKMKTKWNNNMQKFIENMSDKNKLSRLKIAYELNILLKKYDYIKNKYILYFDSGFDIETILLAGYKKIIMCDILFKDTNNKKILFDRISKYGNIQIKENKVILTSKVLGKIEIIVLDYNEYNINIEYEIGTLYGFLKHPMNIELFEMEGIKKSLDPNFIFTDNRKTLSNDKLQEIGFKALGEFTYMAENIEKILSYKSPFIENRDMKIGKGKTVDLSNFGNI